MKIHPDVLAAHAEFGGDLESMQKCFEWYDLRSDVVRLSASNERHKGHIAVLRNALQKIAANDTEAFEDQGVWLPALAAKEAKRVALEALMAGDAYLPPPAETMLEGSNG